MCERTPHVELQLTADTHAAGQARQFLSAHLCHAHCAPLLEDALLLVSEAVTNAVRHGQAPVFVALDCRNDTGLRVNVYDANPAVPKPSRHSLHRESGRGLQLIARTATHWGIESRHPGKAVWFELHPAAGS